MAAHVMSEDEVRAFLTSMPPHTGTLATVRADGRPHLAPVWYDVDDDGTIVFNTGETTVKGRNLARDPRASFCVDDERPPFSFVVLEGTVELSDDLAEVRRWAARIGGRYMGPDRAEEYGERNGVPGELLARLTPTASGVRGRPGRLRSVSPPPAAPARPAGREARHAVAVGPGRRELPQRHDDDGGEQGQQQQVGNDERVQHPLEDPVHRGQPREGPEGADDDQKRGHPALGRRGEDDDAPGHVPGPDDRTEKGQDEQRDAQRLDGAVLGRAHELAPAHVDAR